MAKIKEISCYLGRKVSDGNYGSIDFHGGEVVTLEEGDDVMRENAAMESRVMKRLFKRMADQGIEP